MKNFGKSSSDFRVEKYRGRTVPLAYGLAVAFAGASGSACKPGKPLPRGRETL
jgi:hypothetical protein